MGTVLRSMSQRVLYGAAGIVMLGAVAPLVWFAIEATAIWPGISLGVGLVLAVLSLIVGSRWLRVALTGRRPTRATKLPGRGAV